MGQPRRISLSSAPPRDAVTNAVKLIKYVHDDGEDPGGAWQWWLSPCGGTNLVPDDLETAFDIVGQVTDMGSLEIAKGIKKGSGKKGDNSNSGNGGTRQPGNPPPKNNGNNKKNNATRGVSSWSDSVVRKTGIPSSQRVKHEELHVAIDIKPGPEVSLSWGRTLRSPARQRWVV